MGPKCAFMENTLPLSATVDTCSLISLFIFLVGMCPILLIPPEKLQLPLKVSQRFASPYSLYLQPKTAR